MTIEPYLFFHGRCEEALEYYQKVLGAELTMLMRFKENPGPRTPNTLPRGWDDKVMHSQLRIGDGHVMASDGMSDRPAGFSGFSLSLEAGDEAQAEAWFAALADRGKVEQPLTKTFFSSCFGMVADRFGVDWMVIVPEPAEQGT